jgi:hypothetical protein
MARIFVCYRREDSPGHAGRLYDHLVAHFGEQLVFRDIEAIALGADFVKAIEEAIGASSVLIAVIGPQWLAVQDRLGQRRLDNPKDFVRLELATALARGVRVVPVLMNDATMPTEEELPADLAPLARRNAIEVSDLRFRSDVERLIQAIDEALAEPQAQRLRPSAPPMRRERAPRPRHEGRRWGAVLFVALFTAVVFGSVWTLLRRAPEGPPPAEPPGIGGSGREEAPADRVKKPRPPRKKPVDGKKPGPVDAGTVEGPPDAGQSPLPPPLAKPDAGTPAEPDTGGSGTPLEPTPELLPEPEEPTDTGGTGGSGAAAEDGDAAPTPPPEEGGKVPPSPAPYEPPLESSPSGEVDG